MNKKITILLFASLSCFLSPVFAQHEHGLDEAPVKELFFSGFGELHYNQPLNSTNKNGNLDIHRMVIGMGYRFDYRFSFMAEVAYEHVSEVLIEQMFLRYKKSDAFQITTGLLPVPVGIVNQKHEPDQFNGVEHPALNQYIVPTAWREIGIGINGELENAGLHYQLYVMNGFSSYKEGKGLANGMRAFRTARQEGVESFIKHPNITGRLAYEKISGLEVGASFYLGKTQSELYDTQPKTVADSTVVGLAMAGLDLRYQVNKFHLRGECVYAALNNTDAYNTYTQQDLGKAFLGYYGEIAYDIVKTERYRITPFYRYGNYNTHYKVNKGMSANDAYHQTYHTVGISYLPIPNIILKADYQWIYNAAKDKYNMLNVGVNFIFGK